jgi:hypothetical protein
MKKTFTLILLALFCICGYAQTIDPVLRQEMGRRSDDEKIKVIVIMKSQYDRQQLNRRAAHYVTRAERREFVVNELKQFAEASQYELRSTLSEMERQDMTTTPKIIWMANALYFSATKQAINDLAMRRDIGIIGLDEEKYALFGEESRPANNTRGITANVTQVNADQVWELGYTGQGVVVAVIDTGVNYNHLDLADHLWDGGADYPHHGYDFYNNDNDPMDDHSHGTHCAGTVCGDGTAGQQTGMAPDATLMCVKVLNSSGSGYVSVTCNAMQWAVEQGCDLFSMSLGWANATITERELFRTTCAAVLDAGVVGAIAAGNEGSGNEPNNVRVPGSCPPPYMDPIQANNEGGLSCTVCVGAVDYNDYAAYFTSRGPVTWQNTSFGDYPYTYGSTTDFGLIRPDVCAPGVDIISADYSGTTGYSVKSGTSMATPCTAGCISLLLSKKPDATPEEICQVLEETAVPLAEGKSNTYGYGRVDVLAAINALYSGPLTLDSFTVNDGLGNNDGKLNAGEAVTLNLTLTNDSDLALDGATMVISTQSEYVTITNGTATLPHFNAGQTRTINNMFAFSLSDDAPAKRNIQFMAETFVNGESVGAFRIGVMVYGHILKFNEVTVLNDNNDNGSLEAGETANLHVVISNVGNDPAASVVGALSTAYPYLTINSNNKSFGSLEVNEQASADYNVTLSSGAPDTYSINFSLDLVDAVQKHTDLDFQLWRKPITLVSNPAEAGTLTGAGYYGQNQTCTITATPNNGYAFVSWTLNGEVVSYLPTYSFEVTGAANYVANFQAFNNSVTVGEATGTHSLLPSYSYYNYTLSQQIYTANEINMGAGEISSVSFFNAGYTMTRNYTIYLVNTNKTSFENNYDWITILENDKVFEGSVTMTTGEWTTIYFSTPFAYDGSSNLALIMDDNTGNWYDSMSCRVFDASDNQAIYIYSDYTNYDPYNPTNYYGTRLMVKNEIVLGIPSYEYTVSVSANPTNGGTVSGGGGPYYYGQPISISATANDGYVFNNWTKNGEVVSYLSTCTVPVTETATYVANFQQVDGISIGDATYTNAYIPTYSYYPYALSQQIYTASEIGTGVDEISSVSFFNTGSYDITRKLNVYMVNTDKTSFESTTDWITVSENDLMFSGNVTFNAFGWVTVYFNTAFDYDGVSNVALIVDDNSNSWYSGISCRTFDTEANQAIRVYGSGTNYDPNDSITFAGTLVTVKNQVIFGIPSYDYTVSVSANPIDGGSVSGGGDLYYYGQPVTITATPNEGYVFNSWTKNGEVVSYLSTYTVSVTESAMYVANFEPVDGIVIGNATATNYYLPSFSYYRYTLSQQIFTAEEIGMEAGEISSISFFNTAAARTRKYAVYLVQTDKTTFDSNTDWITVSEADLVYNGSVTFASGNWTSVYFNEPFQYDGTSNIALIIDDNTGSYNSPYMSCRVSPTENNQAIYIYSDGINYDPYNPSEYTGTLPLVKNQIIFGIPSYEYTVTATVNPANSGTVSGGEGLYYLGQPCTLTAIANPGYGFYYWKENGTIKSYDPVYTFQVLGHMQLEACFGEPFPITVSASPSEGGIVSGGGAYGYNQQCTLTATANDGYVFSRWLRNGSVVSCLPTYTFTVTAQAEYVAQFLQVDDHSIAIGVPTNTSSYLPTYTYYPYSLTQQIYTADELNTGACEISSVSFFNAGYGQTRNITIYMVNTNKTAFNGTNDWIAVTEADMVFSGNFSATYRNWSTVYFNTPFNYDGHSNVALIVDDNTNEWYSGTYFRTFDTPTTQAIRVCGSDLNYDPMSPNAYTGTLMSVKNQVIFGIPIYEYTITLSANPEEGGTVSGGGGLYFYGQPVTISAIPSEGYVFNNWTKYNENYGYDEVVSYYAPDNLPATGDVEYMANFQQMDGIIIGQPSHTSMYLPSYTDYPYAMSQQIYTAAEINSGASDISSVSFFNTGYSMTRNLVVYMVNTNKTKFNSAYDWITVTEADQVFSGNVDFYEGWITIYFNTPFAYDGTSNVALIVNDVTNEWNWGMSCRTFDTDNTQALYVVGYDNNYGDYFIINPYNPSLYTGTLMSEKNQVVFGVADFQYMVTVTADPEEGGTVSGGGGPYYYGQPITLTATPNEGYVFNSWTRYDEEYGYDEEVSYLSQDNLPVLGDVEYVAHFQPMDGIIIGEAEKTNQYLPIFYDYNSLSQQIYTAAEMNVDDCEISSVSFFNTDYGDNTNLEIYMVNTSKSAFYSTTDWIPFTENDLVFSGDVYCTSYGWTTIYFDTPFSYDGSSNVALIVNKTNQWAYMNCRTFNTEGTQAIYAFSYDNPIDPNDPSQYYGEILTEKNQVVFGVANYNYTVTVSANPEEGGTVSGGGGPYYYGQPVTLTATANEGYVFNNWTRYNEEYGYDEVVSYLSQDNLPVLGDVEYVAHFQPMDGIIIGEAEYTHQNLPMYYYCSMSQQIFTADELNSGACEISSVSFYNYYSSQTRNLDIYMLNTGKSAFDSSTDWIPVTENDLVFSGRVSLGYGWITIYFITPFNYDGLSNVALVVNDKTNSWSYINCRTFDADGTQAIYAYSYNNTFDPYNPSQYTGELLAEKNQVVFGIPSYDYTVTVSANPTDGGTVSGGGGTYYYGQPITLSATPAEGYVFNSWTKNGTAVSYLSTAQVSVTETAEYVANFEQVDGIVIGDAISTNAYLPMYYYYSLTEQIYTAEEMNTDACEISSVSFFNTGTSNITRKLSIYMVNTDKTSFGSTSDWIPVTDTNLVFNGNVTMTARGWVTLYFNTPFAYDGTSNVALIIDDNSNSYNSYTNCRTFGTEVSQAIRISGSGTNYDPYAPTGYSGILMSVKNQVIFGIPNYEYTLTITANPEEGGTVSGAHDGLYFYGQPAILTATPNEGYVFNNWSKSGTVVSYVSTTQVAVTGNDEYEANFQQMDGILVGDAASTSNVLPTYSYYPYTLSQQIYTADEMGGAATEITSISFFNTGSSNVTRNLSIYMVHTNKTAFGSTSDWITATEADRVFNGNVTIGAKGWTTIVFNNAFQYNGTSNLALIVDDNSNNWSSSISCRTFDTDTRQALYVVGYETNFDPTHPSGNTGSLMTMKNQIVFHRSSMITVTANPTGGGSVSGSGSYFYGATCTVTASPNPGYYFLNWTVDNVVVSYDAAYTFTVNGDTDLVANFVAGWSTCTITFDLYDSYSNGWSGNYLVVDYGDGSPEQLTLPSGSSISYSRTIATGSNITLSWISGSNTYQCSFDVKFENGVPIYHGANLSSSFQQELTINCAVSTAPHTITADVVPEEGGTVEGTGTYDGGTIITLTATPNDGYAFCYWAENGTTVSTDASYTFTVTADRDLVARFSLPINVSVTNNIAEGGTTTGDGVYYYGNTCTLTATPNEGYLFLNWSKNGEVVSCNSTYSFTVTEDADFEAVFMLLEGTLIGSGEATGGALPSTSYYCYTLSQQIYTPNEIGSAGNITSISYYNAGYTKTRNYTIYMVHTDKSTFSNNYDWITVSEADLVYSGSVTMTKGYWNTITLDTPFTYNGTSNLAIIIDDNTGSWTSNSMTCRVYNANGNQAIYTYSDGTNYDPYNPSGYYGTRQTVKNQIILDFDEGGTQSVELAQGWNWFSSYLEITLDDLKAALVAALPGTSITIKSQSNGSTSYNGNTWRGALTTLDVSQMYMIKVNTNCEITLTGMPINPAEHPVTISHGVNWIAFPLSQSMTLSNAFAGFAVSGDKVKSQTTTGNYNGSLWRPSFSLEPGKGYMYISNVHGIRYFIFPTNSKKK